MSSNKSNIHPLNSEFDNDNQPMVVATDIEDIMLIPNIINAIETLFYIGKIFPVRIFDCFNPSF